MRILNGMKLVMKWFLSILLYIEPDIPPANDEERNPITRLRIIPIVVIFLLAALVLYIRLWKNH